MIEVIRVMAPSNGMPFSEVNSFETENYYGIYDHESGRFMLIEKEGTEFRAIRLLANWDTLQELDNEVSMIIDEHITGVSSSSTFRFVIEEEEV